MLNVNKFLLTTILISLAFGQLLRFHFLNFLPSFYLHDLLLVIFLILNFPRLLHLPLNSPLYRKTFLFLVCLTLFNPNYLLTLRLSVYFLSFLLIFNLDLDRPFLLKVNYLIFFMIAFLGLLQYFFLPDLRLLANLGWDDHLNRLTFPYFDPNFTGIFLALGFFLFLPQSSWLAFLFLVPLAFTYSRSAWLSWFLVIATTSKALLRFVLVFLLFVLIFLPHRFGEGNNLLRTYSISARFKHDLTIVQTLVKQPFKGKLIPKYHLNYSLDLAGTANNSFLFLWQVGGLFSLLSFLYLLPELINSTKNKNIWKLIIIASFFNNLLFYPFLLAWVLLFISLNSRFPR